MLPQWRAAEGPTEALSKAIGESCWRQPCRTPNVCQQRNRADGEGQGASGGVIEVDIQAGTLRRKLSRCLQCKVQPPSDETAGDFCCAVPPPGADLGFSSHSVVAAHYLTTGSGTHCLKSSCVH